MAMLCMAIGAEIAMHAVSLYPDLNMRSIFLQPDFSESDYVAVLNKRKDADFRFMVKGGDQQKAKAVVNLNTAMNPMMIYSMLDVECVEYMDAAIKSMALSGNTSVMMNYSDECGITRSVASRAQAMEEITRYI